MALRLLAKRLKALQFERPSWRRRLKALEGRQWLAGNLTADIWPNTGQKVHNRTRHENTYKKHTCVCTTMRTIRCWQFYTSEDINYGTLALLMAPDSFYVLAGAWKFQSPFKSVTDEARHSYLRRCCSKGAIVTSANTTNADTHYCTSGALS